MLIRLYLEDGSVKEVEVVRACDDHGRVVLGQPWPPQEKIAKKLSSLASKEQLGHASIDV
jgi:hypothetical protein